MTVLLVVFALALAACGSQESITAPVQPHPQAAKTGEGAVSEGSAETDWAALVALYEATTGGFDWDNWLCEAPLDQWAGVTTDENGRVTGLELDHNNMSGSIPPELGNLDKLQRLDLSGNELRGLIPPELGNLQNLQYLNLNANDLRGSIPPELGNLQNLQYLNLNANDLRGSIPPELGNLQNLQTLRLFSNNLCGSIPPELGNLKNLQRLTFQANELSGPIPPELGNLSSLQSLNLFANELSGPIPPELGNLSSLQSLDLKRNQLSGEIPPELSKIDSLQRLALSENYLSGPIPPELGNLSSLQSLDLKRNQLSGEIPPELSKIDSLQRLALGENYQLSGCIPSALLNIVTGSGLSVCGDDDESTIVGLYGTLISSFTDVLFAVAVGQTSVPGEGGGSVEVVGNDWTLQDYSPDGALIINGTLNVGITETPIPLTGAIVLSGSQESEITLDMDLSVGPDGLSATGTITINGAEFDVVEVSAAAAAEAAAAEAAR